MDGSGIAKYINQFIFLYDAFKNDCLDTSRPGGVVFMPGRSAGKASK